MPKIFYVNWFRRTSSGGFAWPGFGENIRVVKWIVERLEGKAGGEETPIGIVPTEDELDLTGLEISAEELEAALKVDVQEWKAELPSIDEWFHKLGGVPDVLLEQRAGLEQRLNEA
jgi:phosphoenolpyruvate carboxykinase (GTP)